MSDRTDLDVEEDIDPTFRCHKILNNGKQCNYHAVKGARFCTQHGGMIGFKSAARKGMLQTRWNQRIMELASHPDIFNLGEEIGVVRMTLESVLNNSNSELELLGNVPQIQKLTAQIQALVTQCERIQRVNSNLMSQSQIVDWSMKLVSAITEVIDDEDTMNRIRDSVTAVVREMTGASEEETESETQGTEEHRDPVPDDS
jgi:hypothetical protein